MYYPFIIQVTQFSTKAESEQEAMSDIIRSMVQVIQLRLIQDIPVAHGLALGLALETCKVMEYKLDPLALDRVYI